jgi:hypothetical protein
LALSGGHVAAVDADGNVEVEKQEHVDALTAIGFTAAFVRKGKEKAAAEPGTTAATNAPTAPAEPVSAGGEDEDAEGDEEDEAVKGKTAARGRGRR